MEYERDCWQGKVECVREIVDGARLRERDSRKARFRVREIVGRARWNVREIVGRQGGV